MNIYECIGKFIEKFPYKKFWIEKCTDIGGKFHVDKFFYEALGFSLKELLEKNAEPEIIKEYCEFVELMQLEGDDVVQKNMIVSVMMPIEDS